MFAADISKGLDRARLCDFALRWRGGVDLLINNAAVNDFNLLTTQSADELDAAVTTNLIAPIDLCRRLIPRLELGDDARIVNIGSVLGSIGFAGTVLLRHQVRAARLLRVAPSRAGGHQYPRALLRATHHSNYFQQHSW